MRKEKETAKDPELIVEKKGGFLGKLIALLLGIVIGFISCIGGVAAIGYFFLKKIKVEEGFNYINDATGQNIDYTQYINGSYGEKTVQELFETIGNTLTGISNGEGTLKDLNDISPLIGKAIKGDPDSELLKEGLVDKLAEYGIQMDGDKFMDRVVVKPDGEAENPDKYLGDYLKNCINETPVGDILEAMDYELNDLSHQLCYGEEGDEPLTIGGFLSDDLTDKLYTIPLETLLNPDTEDKIMLSINYGPTHRYTIVEGAEDPIQMKPLFYQIDLAPILALKELKDALTNANSQYKGKAQLVLNAQGGILTYNGNNYPAPTNILLDDSGHALVGEKGKYSQVKLTIDFDKQSLTLELTDKDGEVLPLQYVSIDPNVEPGTTITKVYAFEDEKLETAIEFKKVTVGDLESEGSDIIRSISLKDALNVTEETKNKLLHAIVYEKNGTTTRERTIDDLWTNGSDIINGIHLADMLHIDLNNHLIAYFLYGKEDVHYKKVVDPEWVRPINPETGLPDETAKPEYIAEMKPKYVSVIEVGEPGNTVQKVYNEYGDQYLGNMTAKNGRFYCTINQVNYELVLAEDLETPLAPIEIEETKDVFYTADLYYVFDLNGKQVYFEEPTLGEFMAEDSPILNNIMGHLTVSDILGDKQAGGNKILTLMRDVPIDQMAVEVNKLCIVDIFEDDIYKKDDDGEFITDGDGKRVMQPTWKYLLTGEDDVLNTDLTIENGMSAMMDNMTRNIQKATIAELVGDKILTLSGESEKLYGKYIENPSAYPNSPFGWTITETLEEALNSSLPTP